VSDESESVGWVRAPRCGGQTQGSQCWWSNVMRVSEERKSTLQYFSSGASRVFIKAAWQLSTDQHSH